jgi:hypothetical protein
VPHEATDEFRFYWPKGQPVSANAHKYVGEIVTVRGWTLTWVENGIGPGGKGRTAHPRWFGRVVELLFQIPEDELIPIHKANPK